MGAEYGLSTITKAIATAAGGGLAALLQLIREVNDEEEKARQKATGG